MYYEPVIVGLNINRISQKKNKTKKTRNMQRIIIIMTTKASTEKKDHISFYIPIRFWVVEQKCNMAWIKM